MDCFGIREYESNSIVNLEYVLQILPYSACLIVNVLLAGKLRSKQKMLVALLGCYAIVYFFDWLI